MYIGQVVFTMNAHRTSCIYNECKGDDSVLCYDLCNQMLDHVCIEHETKNGMKVHDVDIFLDIHVDTIYIILMVKVVQKRDI